MHGQKIVTTQWSLHVVHDILGIKTKNNNKRPSKIGQQQKKNGIP